jgi:hypothetical protein
MDRRQTIITAITLAVACGLLAAGAIAADASGISGTWTASFDSQVGVQNYTYTFKVDGSTLTGRAKSDNGDVEITEGRIDKDTLTFVENMDYQGMALKITYQGQVVSANEIKFKRDVGGQGGEEFSARRK